MKRLLAALFLIFCSSVCMAQVPTNVPNTVTITQAGVPSGNCSANFQYVNATNGDLYTCSAGSWVKVGGSGSGTVSGQANGVIPLATASTTIGAQSHLADNGSVVTTTESFNGIVYVGNSTYAATAAGINSAIASFGSAPNCGTIVLPLGESDAAVTIGGTNLSGRYGCVFEGQGAPPASSSKGTYIKWTGSANGTIVDLHSCENCRIENVILDGNASAGIGLNITSAAADGISIQNLAKNLVILGMTGTPGYGVHVGGASGFEVQLADLEDITINGAKIAVYQDGASSNSITYRNMQMGGEVTACMEFVASDALVDRAVCSLLTGATGLTS